MTVYDELRGMVVDLPVGTILPGWVSKAAVIVAIDKLEEERAAPDWDHSCATCLEGGHSAPPPHRMREGAG